MNGIKALRRFSLGCSFEKEAAANSKSYGFNVSPVLVLMNFIHSILLRFIRCNEIYVTDMNIHGFKHGK